jgi:hypothetical protein
MARLCDIMLSYRIIDTGAQLLGGDGTVVCVKAWLEAAGTISYSEAPSVLIRL